MEGEQSFEDAEEEEDEAEDVPASKKRPASSPAAKSQVCVARCHGDQLLLLMMIRQPSN